MKRIASEKKKSESSLVLANETVLYDMRTLKYHREYVTMADCLIHHWKHETLQCPACKGLNGWGWVEDGTAEPFFGLNRSQEAYRLSSKYKIEKPPLWKRIIRAFMVWIW
jgi:hypothetical protein